MLQRIVSTTGVVFYQSPLLARAGIPHGFSTRLGGVSDAPFDSLNLGNPNGCAVQDDLERIAQNYQRLQAACGLAGRRWCRVHQVHGAQAICVDSLETYTEDLQADAIATRDPRIAVSVRIADCVPLLIATSDGGTVAAVHAGWRGVIAGVAVNAIAAIGRLSGNHGPLLAAIGPCISTDAFEVGSEVAEEFAATFGAGAPIHIPQPGAKPHIDLREALRMQLVHTEIKPEHIDTTDRCTVADRDEFFSHRRDNGVTGRMAAMIGVVKIA